MNLNRRARLFFVWASLLTGLTYTQNLMAVTTCSITSLSSLTNLSYDPMNGSPTLSAITFSIRCNGGGGRVNTIELSIGGATSSSDFSTRVMTLNDKLYYQLYRDPARTIVWGNGPQNSNSSANYTRYNFSNGETKNFTIYVMIPALQNIYSGTYTVTPGPVITIRY